MKVTITVHEMPARPTLGDRFDQIADRMDAAYVARKRQRVGSPEYDSASDTIEAVYADLRALNAEVATR